jgi:4-amino-4-deoxy-L-arabinose transferase-like glycosyltransferase
LYLSRGIIGQAYFFLGISFLYGWSSGLIDKKTKNVKPNWIIPAFILALIILLGFFLRSYALGEISYRFDHYESDYAREALSVLSGHHNVNLWRSTIWRGLGHLNYSPVYVYYAALFFQVFGATLVTLKMVAVTWGIFALLLTYGIVSTLFSRRLALITVFLLAISPLHINYSRTGLLLISTQAVSLLVVYLLLRAIIRRKLLSYILLGIAISFAGYFYSPAKYPILLAAVLIVCYSIFKRRWFRRNLAGIILLVLTVITLMTTLNIPAWDVMAPKFAGYESVWHRTQGHQYTPQADYLRGIPLVQENLEKLIHSFFISRNFNYDPWPRGNLYFNPLIPPLFLLGIAFSLSRIKKANYRLLLFFAAAFLIPNLLSRPPVMVRRLMVAWPFIYCLAAIPISQLLKQSGKLGGRIGTGLAAVPIIAILLTLGADNSMIYFNSNEPAGRWEEERFYDEYAKKLIKDYYLLLVPINDLSRKTLSFILYETKGAGSRGFKYVSPEQIRNLKWEDISSRLPAALLCTPGKVSRSDLEQLQQRFGRGRIEEFKDKFNRQRAVSLFLEE